MERDRNVTFVIFAEGVKLSDFRGRYWRLLRRKPLTFWFLCWHWVSGVVGGSAFRHVLVGDGEVVYDAQFGKAGFWPWEYCIKKFPRIIGFYVIQGKDPQIHQYPMVDRRKWGWFLPIPFLLMAASRGLYQIPNCTTASTKALRDAGVDVPRRIWNPTKLHLWMSENGFDFFAAAPPSFCETADRGAGQAESASSGGIKPDQC